ncbi:Dynamin family protein [Bacillus sp. DNRA2]|uniref:dynamin family protein n=1 Tax=Bacillus sp. DNRA2 TaxID=2723053 RepID=UPI00145D8E01|nr:dynamin family protein [Bacillus sp. DNRA2]NMD72447.1 Dynamin family protein [Bacillus sp. DNRA2]
MVQIIEQKEQSLLGKIAVLYDLFKQNQDEQTAHRAEQLAKKLSKQEFSIAFCGHFSAGKSTMINRLVGENLLPSSPIPTSANLVKVKTGDEYAKVIFKKGKPRVYLAPYDYEKVKTYCKDGDEIEAVEISHQSSSLPNNVIIMDTPGIDSTDDAHRIATESALHLADLIFYVMDYNHVQSEVNFLFTKELTQAGKQLCLVINQVDKHRDEELSFDGFQESVEQSFASWGVRPEHILYTSLKFPENQHNQFPELQELLHEKISHREEILPVTILHSLIKLTNDHIKIIKEQDEASIAALEDKLTDITETERLGLKERIDQIEKVLEQLHAQVEQKSQDINDEVDEILDNAYIMPFQTRELAKQYIESCQTNFKVGLFFAKNKTEQERTQRRESLYVELADRVKSQVEWHLRQLALRILKDNNAEKPELMEAAQSISVAFSYELLESNLKPGAMLSGEYVLNYTNDVVNSIKRLSRNSMSTWKELYLQELKRKNAIAMADVNQELEQLKEWQIAVDQLTAMFDRHEQSQQTIHSALNEELDFTKYKNLAESLAAALEEDVEIIRDSLQNKEIEETKPEANAAVEEQQDTSTQVVSKDQIERIVSHLRLSANKVKSVPGLEKVSVELKHRADRLESQQFTVALFGAFSAGKSSFANALIGEKILPVSPNPTTAAINRIKPIDANHHHGTVLVKLKNPDTLLDDVRRSLEVFDSGARDFADALKSIVKILGSEEHLDAYSKVHYAFLRAFNNGYANYEASLGQIIETDLTEFRDFVAMEEKSCLVEWIDVYYDCPLTKEGITLVDTPGADSINARHTNVAFEYIKSSDAILFVTYYNHAFSKADREFLIQLGRVKDTFELDKMFFIINAIDLANSDEEMAQVIDYVKDQLVSYGIRKPSMFAISSLLAIQEKMGQLDSNKSRINIFEKAFYHFISGDLKEMVVDAAKAEHARTVQILQQMISSAQEDKSVKERKRLAAISEHEEVHSFIQQQNADFMKKRLVQEADELLYYIKQRVFFRFGDFFKESFSPAVLKEDGRNIKKTLQHCLHELIEAIGYDFTQEIRATTLRLEAYINKLLKERSQQLASELKERNQNLSFSLFEPEKLDGLQVELAFQALDLKLFQKALTYYKNAKAFFEKNEKKLMQEELERVLQDPSEQYLQVEGEQAKAYYLQALEVETVKLIDHITVQIDEYYKGIIASLSDEFPIEELLEIEKEIRDIH